MAYIHSIYLWHIFIAHTYAHFIHIAHIIHTMHEIHIYCTGSDKM